MPLSSRFLGFFDFNEIVGDNATKEVKDAKKLRNSETEQDRKVHSLRGEIGAGK